MKRYAKHSGFTLVELLMALIVTSIVLAAVATLANAATSAKKATDAMGREQGQLRQLTLYLTDMIRRANGVTSSSEGEFVLWHDTNCDGYDTSEELTRIRRGADTNGLEIVDWGLYGICKNIEIHYDAAAPDTRFIMIGFTVIENGQSAKHTINAKLYP